MPARFKSSIPSFQAVFLGVDYPFDACLDNQFWSILCRGEAVTYMVAPLLLLFERAILVMAFASAWSTYGLVTLFSSSHTFSKPEGVPL